MHLYSGGMETLFGDVAELELELEEEMVLGHLITHLKDNYLKEREELFIQTSDKPTEEEEGADKKMNTV